jgi:hypothetical protein
VAAAAVAALLLVGVGTVALAKWGWPREEGQQASVTPADDGTGKEDEQKKDGPAPQEKEVKTGPEKKVPAVVPARPSLRVLSLVVTIDRVLDKSSTQIVGEVGKDVFEAQVKNQAYVKVRLNRPAYCYLIAYNTDGTEQALYPEAPDSSPEALQEINYPAAGQPPFQFDEGPGLQAFALIVSRDQLPPFPSWKMQGRAVVWAKMPPQHACGTWWSDGNYARALDRRTQRNVGLHPSVVVSLASLRLDGTPSLGALPWGGWYAAGQYDGPMRRARDLARSLRNKPGADVVEVQAFAVRLGKKEAADR